MNDLIKNLDTSVRSELQAHQQQLDVLLAGARRTFEISGTPPTRIDTTATTIAIVKETVAQLRAYCTDFGVALYSETETR